MILYTCGQKLAGPASMHPCAKAGKALTDAGYEFEIRTVGGYRLMPVDLVPTEPGAGGGQEAERDP